MPSNSKKRKNSELRQSNKRIKLSTADVPAPQHITIDNDCVVYHFPDRTQANDFRRALPLVGVSEGVLHSCVHSSALIGCVMVSLTANLVDMWIGYGAYNKLASIYNILQDEEYIRLAAELTDLDTMIANQVALFVDYDNWNLLAAISQKSFFPHWSIMPFLQRLNKETVTQAVQHPINRTIAFMILLDNFNPDATLLILNLLDETCNKLALQQNADGYTILSYTSSMSPEIYIALLNKLCSDTCNKAALLMNNEGRTVFEHIAEWYPGEVFRLFEQKLTFETRISTVFTSYMDVHRGRNGFSSTPFTLCQADKAAVKLISTALQNPGELKKQAAQATQLLKIDLYDSGSSFDTWSGMARNMIRRAPAAKKRPAELDLSNSVATLTEKDKSHNVDYMRQLSEQGWKFLRIQGRTIILYDKIGNLRAVKVQKKKESPAALFNEFQTTNYLKKNADKLGLKSQFPSPVLATKISWLNDWLISNLPQQYFEKFIELALTEKKQTVYVYDVDPKKCDYFTYLHDSSLSDQAFNEANRNAVNDLFTLLKHGIVFPQLGDIFHNLEHIDDRDDQGRYMVLVNILRDFGSRGTGRLTGWKEAVNYPNLRASGIADLGDRASINDYINGELARKYYSETQQLYGNKAANYLLANIMAEYQYVIFLNAGRRGYALTEDAKKSNKLPDEIDAIWLKLAKQIMDNCIQATSILINQKENEIAPILNATVDVTRLARQMRYWMTEEYIADVMANKIKNDIYEPGARVRVDIHNFRDNTFNQVIGCSIDGVHQDLGPVNGQEPIKEANNLFYKMVTKVFETYNLLHMSVKDLKIVTEEADIVKSENLRHRLFTHLPEKQFHKLQMALCEERLKQKNLPEEIRTTIAKESVAHKIEYAVLTIQNFWRNARQNAEPVEEKNLVMKY